ncbi:MAG: hypothetical protein JRF32_00690 [Deltaproteobacteria bacterium]|nr:hypothetical protein [Deltaproteobacteria bacterium]
MNYKWISDKNAVIMWYRLNKIERCDDNKIRADIQVPPSSPWFDGHFPGEPVLPGLAQLGMVFDVIKKVAGGNLKIASVSRVRFKRIVRPDDLLKVIAAPLKRDVKAYTFQILIQDEQVSSGVIRFEKEEREGFAQKM